MTLRATPLPPPELAPVVVTREPLGDGGFVLRAPDATGDAPRVVGEMLRAWAQKTPDALFLAERDAAGAWRRVTYSEAYDAVLSLAQALLDEGLSATRPLLLLSGNGVDHALLQLAGMHVGVPVAPISPAYSLQSNDFAKLKTLAKITRPGAVYAGEGAAFAAALRALDLDIPVLVSRGAEALTSGHAHAHARVRTVSDAARTPASRAVGEAFARTGPDTVAKVLFTSGSTGAPKGVANTQRMLTSNQHGIAETWPFLKRRPPVVVDWLPWSHTFGGNHNFFLVLWHGGALYIDNGKPAPGAFDETLRNLREISPSIYFNVPRGFDLLVSHLEKDDALCETFFANLDLLFYAAAALPQSTWARLESVSRRARGDAVTMVSAWGLTETAPLATQVHAPITSAGIIGVPSRGTSLAFVPVGQKLEMRVRGPNVSPGYWTAGGALVPLPQDDDGFFPTGDAGRLADDARPELGVVFDGRIAENFKLTSGTWVHVGELRVAVIAALAPFVADAVVAGHARDDVGILMFLAPGAEPGAELDATLRGRLEAFNGDRSGSSRRVARALVLREPPQIDAGEITDKGYLNQRVILERRADEVSALYASDPRVIVVG